MSRLDSQIRQFEAWQNAISDLSVLVEVGLEEGDESVADEVEAGCKRLNNELERFEFKRLLAITTNRQLLSQ